MVMREMLWILGIGLAIGVPAALALARYTESQLYGVKAYDAGGGGRRHAGPGGDGGCGGIPARAPGVAREPARRAQVRVGVEQDGILRGGW